MPTTHWWWRLFGRSVKRRQHTHHSSAVIHFYTFFTFGVLERALPWYTRCRPPRLPPLHTRMGMHAEIIQEQRMLLLLLLSHIISCQYLDLEPVVTQRCRSPRKIRRSEKPNETKIRPGSTTLSRLKTHLRRPRRTTDKSKDTLYKDTAASLAELGGWWLVLGLVAELNPSGWLSLR